MSDNETLNFGQALEALQQGQRVRNIGWNHDNSYLELQTPDDNSKMTQPYIYFNKPCGDAPDGTLRVPWVASQFDLLRGQWVIISSEEQRQAA